MNSENIVFFSELFFDLSHYTFSIVLFRRPIPAINLLPFSLFSRYAVHFYTNTQYSKGAGRVPCGRLAGETYIVNYIFSVFSGFGERLGWVGFNYMHNRYYSRLLTTIYQYSSFDFTTYIKSTGGPEYFLRLTTTASSLGILTTTVSRTIRYKSMTSADGGSYAVQSVSYTHLTLPTKA